MILAISAAIAQKPLPVDTTVTPVNELSAHWNIVQTEIERITRDTPESPVGNKLEMVGTIEGKAIRSLFPGWAFYALRYSNYIKEGYDGKHVSLAFGLGHTFAVSPYSREGMRLYHYGNYEEYGHLLRETKVAISNARDAKLVWDAFCEIHRKAWKDFTVEKVSETEWKLGVYSYEQPISVVDGVGTIVKITHFMQVTTDPFSKQITIWKSIVETSKKRPERTR